MYKKHLDNNQNILKNKINDEIKLFFEKSGLFPTFYNNKLNILNNINIKLINVIKQNHY